MKQLEKEYTVHVYETGPDSGASIYTLFNYMQDIASEHAAILGFGRDDLMKKNHFWVLSRMYAEILARPKWEDRIIVRTWPNGTDRMFAMRNYEIHSSDRKMIASATSAWLIVDRSTKKIQRPDEHLTQFRDPGRLATSARNPVKLPELTGNITEDHPFRVRLSDLDVNLHTNNANYVKWAYDHYDLNFVMNHSSCSAEINYLGESMFNEEIIIRNSQPDDGRNEFHHSIVRTSDNKELCRIRLNWKKSGNQY
jgi:medium-chain acyl-[acyl-carrier-protein] hydrolase